MNGPKEDFTFYVHPKLSMLEILAYGSQKIKGEKKEALEFSKSLTKHWLQDISLSHVQYPFLIRVLYIIHHINYAFKGVWKSIYTYTAILAYLMGKFK